MRGFGRRSIVYYYEKREVPITAATARIVSRWTEEEDEAASLTTAAGLRGPVCEPPDAEVGVTGEAAGMFST